MAVSCPYCPTDHACRNDLLHHIMLDHDGDMSEWPAPEGMD